MCVCVCVCVSPTVDGYLGCLQFLQYDQNVYKHCFTYS